MESFYKFADEASQDNNLYSTPCKFLSLKAHFLTLNYLLFFDNPGLKVTFEVPASHGWNPGSSYSHPDAMVMCHTMN